MIQPTFSLAYTSVRASKINAVIELWRNNAVNPSAIEAIICIDEGNSECLAAANSVSNAKVIVNKGPKNCVSGWNTAASTATGKVIICIADDFLPPKNWDESLLTLKPVNWINDDWIVHVASGYVEDIPVLSILTRKRYERFGYVFYPQYESIFCDTEFGAVAYSEGHVINAKHILMEHLHPDCYKRPRDRFDEIHASKDRWRIGEMLFNYRKHRGFPVDDGPKAGTDPVNDSDGKTGIVGLKGDEGQPGISSEIPYKDYAAYIQANRDDLCLNEVCQRLFDEGIRHFFFCIPDEYWSGKPTPHSDVQQVLDTAFKLREQGAEAKTKMFTVADYRFSGDSRITVETRVRNDSLAWVRQNRFTNICVVDSDELWPRGSLAIVKEAVDNAHPLAISLPMTPVVGFPGYPVEGATDRVTSYVGQSCVFRDCRTPVGQVYYENRIRVFHFTSTRRTMEETIEKHRESGHFDDPDYDFENWLKNVLPNIKPGTKNAHMFKRYQIWPEVRSWKPDDLVHIPTSIWPYLAISPDIISQSVEKEKQMDAKALGHA